MNKLIQIQQTGPSEVIETLEPLVTSDGEGIYELVFSSSLILLTVFILVIKKRKTR